MAEERAAALQAHLAEPPESERSSLRLVEWKLANIQRRGELQIFEAAVANTKIIGREGA